MTSFGMERLTFRLHDFTRLLWINDHAKEVWQPRISQIVQCWQEIAWRAVATGMQSCAIQVIAPQQLSAWTDRMTEQHMVILTLDNIPARASAYSTVLSEVRPEEPYNQRVAIGSAENIERFKRAWEAGDQSELQTLQGYPTCCRDFFVKAWIEERFLDTTWPMTFNTVTKKELSPTSYEVEGSAQCNILLRWLGVRAVPHLPCSFACSATVERADQLSVLWQKAGYTAELAWMQEMLAWPVEWSALHGIAEIKTPVLKIATVTDATAQKYTVRRQGNTYPSEGVHGLTFPYRQPTRLRLTGSRSFQRGLAHPIENSTVGEAADT